MESNTDRPGRIFGPYRLEALLGRGGMGEVYRAHDTVRDRTVALKLLPPHLAQNPEFQERFRRECQTVARLDEPHVIPIHDFGEIGGQLYLDMRLVNGRDLRSIMNERGAIPPTEALTIVEQIAAALDAAHRAGLVHRDVKPENILVTQANFAYLVDFGVAHADSDTHLTKTGTAIGSIAYMAPEQFDDSPTAATIDVYALSAVLFELVTGRKPYPGESVSTITRGVLFDPIPVASTVNPAVPYALSEVLAWGLAKTPAQRCKSVSEMTSAVRAAIAATTPVTPEATRQIPPAAPTEHLSQTRPPASQVTAVAPARAGTNQYGAHTAPPPHPTSSARPAPAKRNLGPLIAIAVLAVALLGVGAAFLISRSDSSRLNDPTIAAALTTGGDTTTLTATETPEIVASTTTTGIGTSSALPAGARPCPNNPGVATHEGRKTSCEFAVTVRDAYYATGPVGGTRIVNGWAPTQQASVPMSCGPAGGIVICTGGTQSIVYLY